MNICLAGETYENYIMCNWFELLCSYGTLSHSGEKVKITTVDKCQFQGFWHYTIFKLKGMLFWFLPALNLLLFAFQRTLTKYMIILCQVSQFFFSADGRVYMRKFKWPWTCIAMWGSSTFSVMLGVCEDWHQVIFLQLNSACPKRQLSWR